MSKLVSLETWAQSVYGDEKPCPNTLRAWARKSLIWPPPVKHGRSYFVHPDAAYTALDSPKRAGRPTLLDRINAATPKKCA